MSKKKKTVKAEEKQTKKKTAKKPVAGKTTTGKNTGFGAGKTATGNKSGSGRTSQSAKRTVPKLRKNKAESNAKKKKEEVKQKRKAGLPVVENAPKPKRRNSTAGKSRTEEKKNKGRATRSSKQTSPKKNTPQKSVVRTTEETISLKATTVPIKRTPNGRTLKTKDEYLPQEKSKVEELKEKRWVAVIDSNQKNELAVVRLTDEKQENTTALPTYKKGNKRDTYFKHFVEIEDNEGNAIKATPQGKFQENPPDLDLTAREIADIKEKVLNHTKQTSKNRENIEKLHKNDKK